MNIRQAALDLYVPPFRLDHGYIRDSNGQVVADDGSGTAVGTIATRIRGWGRIQYMDKPEQRAEALQDEVGHIVVEALNAYWVANTQTVRREVPAAQEDALDAARRLFDAGWKAAARYCGRDDVVADGIIGFGACPQFEAEFAAALAKWGRTAPEAQAKAAPDFYTVFARYEEEDGETGWIPLPGYSNETEHGVKNLVLEAARKEGYAGTAAGRLMELGWEIRPVYLAAAPAAPVREPLAAETIMKIVMDVEQQHHFFRGTTNWAVAVGRAIEFAHGITAPSGKRENK